MYNISGQQENQSRIYRFGQWFLMLFVNRFPNLHKMDNLVVDCKQRTVKSGKTLEPILKTSHKKAQIFKLSNWEFERLNTILKNRESTKSVAEDVVTRQEFNKRIDRLEAMLRQAILQK